MRVRSRWPSVSLGSGCEPAKSCSGRDRRAPDEIAALDRQLRRNEATEGETDDVGRAEVESLDEGSDVRGEHRNAAGAARFHRLTMSAEIGNHHAVVL